MKFRKKPVVIDAVRWTGDNDGEIRTFLGHDFNILDHDRLCIETLEGIMAAPVGHWIIRGVKGEFYPCDPEIFEATYEPADGEVSA